jgi:AsmA protein
VENDVAGASGGLFHVAAAARIGGALFLKRFPPALRRSDDRPESSSMKRLVPLLLLPLLLVLGAAVAAPKLASEERLRAEALAALGEVAGVEPRIEGKVGFVVLPWPAIEIEGLSLGSDALASLTVPQARIVLHVMPLLTGQVRPQRIELDQPELVIANGTLRDASSFGVLVGQLGTDSRSASLRVSGGRLVVRQGDAPVTILRQVDGNISWRGGRDLAVEGSADWRGERLDTKLRFNELAALAQGQAARARLSVSGAPFAFKFDGTAKFAGEPVAEGDVSLSSTKLRDLLSWLDIDTPTREGFGPFSLQARALLDPDNAAISNARIELDGNRSEGGFTLRHDLGRIVVQGSFAAGTLDLSSYGRLAISDPDSREWSRTPIDLEPLGTLDLDLRLSVGEVRAGGSSIDHVAASALLKGGRLALTIGEAEAWNGSFRAAANIAASASGPGTDVRVELAGTDVDLETSLGDLFQLERLQGTGTFRVVLGGTGESVSDIAGNLAGSLTLNAAPGAILGIDVARVLGRLESRPLSGSGSLRGGRTPFDTLDGKATVAQGVAHIDELTVASPTVRIAVGGDISIGRRDLDLKGVASLVAPDAATGEAATSSFDLPFVAQGPWDSPFLLPDPQALIRRSGAARPLLGAEAIGAVAPAP